MANSVKRIIYMNCHNDLILFAFKILCIELENKEIKPRLLW